MKDELEVLSSMVLFDRYEITPMSKAKMLADDLDKAIKVITEDLEAIILEREEEIEELYNKLDKYEPRLQPKKYV